MMSSELNPPSYYQTLSNEEKRSLTQPQTDALPAYQQQQPAMSAFSAGPPGYVRIPVSQHVQFVAVGGTVPESGMTFMPQASAVQYLTVDECGLPDNHLYLISVITVLCAILNLTSLVFGIPALMFAYNALTEKYKGNYGSAKRYTDIGVMLSFINLTYTGFVTVLITFVTGIVPYLTAVSL